MGAGHAESTPGAPRSLSVAVSGTAATLKWLEPASGATPTSDEYVKKNLNTGNTLSRTTTSTTGTLDLIAGEPYQFRVRGCTGGVCGPWSPWSTTYTASSDPGGGTVVPAGSDVGTVVPARLLDTRPDGETVDGLFEGAGKVLAGSFTTVKVAGRGGVPADAVGVEVNITAIQNEGRGFATLYPCTDERPTASTLNYTPGVNIANATTVALNANGEVCLYTSTTAHYALDVLAHLDPSPA